MTDFLIARELQYFALTFNARTGGTKAYTLDLPTLAQITGLSAAQLNER